MRIALGIEYDGTSYNGWQRQKNGIGVQQRLEEALALVANEAVEVVCAGRTDTGVHASGQVAHFDTSADRSERGWLLGANTNLPPDISVSWVQHVSPISASPGCSTSATTFTRAFPRRVAAIATSS
jgi:tRNA pseudouridine38-40 synthase